MFCDSSAATNNQMDFKDYSDDDDDDTVYFYDIQYVTGSQCLGAGPEYHLVVFRSER